MGYWTTRLDSVQWTRIGTNSTVAAGPRSPVHFQKLVVLTKWTKCSVLLENLVCKRCSWFHQLASVLGNWTNRHEHRQAISASLTDAAPKVYVIVCLVVIRFHLAPLLVKWPDWPDWKTN